MTTRLFICRQGFLLFFSLWTFVPAPPCVIQGVPAECGSCGSMGISSLANSITAPQRASPSSLILAVCGTVEE
ncbi:hypothetical protein BC826DRAFT_993689 [Russula brevipes]|nr:hypothetical protein BC826DRAFT_993689 [Russula brevipes]